MGSCSRRSPALAVYGSGEHRNASRHRSAEGCSHGRFCRKGLSPPGEPCSGHMLSNGKACLNAGQLLGFCRSPRPDIPAPVAHKVAASREVLLGKEDLPISATAPLRSDRARGACIHCRNGQSFAVPPLETQRVHRRTFCLMLDHSLFSSPELEMPITSRRRFLASSISVSTMLLTSSAWADESQADKRNPAEPIIDIHQHTTYRRERRAQSAASQ